MDQLRLNAESVGDGILYVIDDRAPRPKSGQEWTVLSEDVLGEFDVKGVDTVEGSYRPNRDYRLLSERGFFQLDDEMAETLMVHLDSLPDPDDPTPSWDWHFIN